MRENLAQRAYEILREKIARLEISPGTALIEKNLCEELDISRTPVREALRRLQSEGFCHYEKNVGSIASPLSMEDFQELDEIRTVLEVLSVRLACRTWTDAEILHQVEEAMMEQIFALGEEDVESVLFLEADKKFHLLIAQLGGNRHLERQLDCVLDLYYRYNYYTSFSHRTLLSLREHMDILHAVKNRETLLAKSLVEEHLSSIRTSILRGLYRPADENQTVGCTLR